MTAFPPALLTTTAPAAGARAPLTIDFPEPLDHGLLHRMIEVVDAAGRNVRGVNEVANEERSWLFIPAAPWTRGVYSLRVDTALEDLAGNKIDRLFDVDLDVFQPIQKQVRKKTQTIPLRIR